MAIPGIGVVVRCMIGAIAILCGPPQDGISRLESKTVDLQRLRHKKRPVEVDADEDEPGAPSPWLVSAGRSPSNCASPPRERTRPPIKGNGMAARAGDL